ncbi:hypothetical protein MGYG_08029 [Nannizzia gypsea CBS 118893]|uniref:Uncharacterized protein n=1 Tax=Arthroderma gypseum (strain ATCC MYA-4604 / CBS 118893) TaxID=535722 RepID=E4V4V1_ARTGP|nr:hypothetical protein MGYG_08029 [Nannizzia gypsea CBS 118893]EFR05025.1 hypothetical protein MGYG_08029 [Nannizzia gypsea CBS 118893]
MSSRAPEQARVARYPSLQEQVITDMTTLQRLDCPVTSLQNINIFVKSPKRHAQQAFDQLRFIQVAAASDETWMADSGLLDVPKSSLMAAFNGALGVTHNFQSRQKYERTKSF